VAALATAIVTGPLAAEAQPAPPPAAEPVPAAPAASGLAALGLKGFLLYKNFTSLYETSSDDERVRNEGLLELEWARRLAPWADTRVVVDVRGDDGDLTDGVSFQIPETTRRRSIVNVKEATLSLRHGPVEVIGGKQIFAWGTADGFNPTDNLNPYDYLDPIDAEKLAVWSAAARATMGPAGLTFVIVPFFTPSRTPLIGGRWAPPPPPGVIADDREVPGRELDNIQYAARLRGTTHGVDLSLSYFDGFEHLPSIRQSEVTLGGVAIPRFTPVFTRIKAVGGDVSTTFGKLEVHGEVAAKFVEENGRHDRFQAIVGVNYAWDELPVRWLEQVALIAEYARETPISSARPDLLDPVALRAFRDTALARLAFKFSEDTSLKLTAVLDFTGSPNHYLQAKVSHKLTDTWHVEAGFDVFGGDRDTTYGRWTDNDRFFLSVKYYF
jgi:hypothetical protein